MSKATHTEKRHNLPQLLWKRAAEGQKTIGSRDPAAVDLLSTQDSLVFNALKDASVNFIEPSMARLHLDTHSRALEIDVQPITGPQRVLLHPILIRLQANHGGVVSNLLLQTLVRLAFGSRFPPRSPRATTLRPRTRRLSFRKPAGFKDFAP